MGHTSLSSLPPTVIRHVAEYLITSMPFCGSEKILFCMKARGYLDISALSTVSRSLRAALMPIMFGTTIFHWGGGDQSKVKIGKRIRQVVDLGNVLRTVTLLSVGVVDPLDFAILARCILSMSSLKSYLHLGEYPLPPLLATALRSNPSVDDFAFTFFSLDSIASLGLKLNLRRLTVSATSDSSCLPAFLAWAPLQIGRERRMGSPDFAKAGPLVPSPSEINGFLEKHLAPLLLSSAKSLEYFKIEGTLLPPSWLSTLFRAMTNRNGGAVPHFDNLKSLELSTEEIGSIFFLKLVTMGRLENLSISVRGGEVARLRGLEGAKLTALKKFVYTSAKAANDPRASDLEDFLAGTSLKKLDIQAISSAASCQLLSSPKIIWNQLRHLNLKFTTKISNELLRQIGSACPQLTQLSLLGPSFDSSMEYAAPLLARLLPRLQKFLFIDNWKTMTPNPGKQLPGKTIRSYHNLDFESLSVPTAFGNTSVRVFNESQEGDMKALIEKDVQDIRPRILARMRKLALIWPTLSHIVWYPTSEIQWDFEIREKVDDIVIEDDVKIRVNCFCDVAESVHSWGVGKLF